MQSLTRRTLLARSGQGGLSLAAAGLVAACGSSSSSPTSAATTATHPAQPRRGGTLTAGLTGGSSSDTLDPNIATTNPDYARIASLYEGLVWPNAQAQPQLRLAQEITPNRSATVWTVRLRKGVMFHDGRELTADDFMFSLNRVIKSKPPGEGAYIFAGLDLPAVKKLDTHTVALPFHAPNSIFVDSLMTGLTMYLLPTNFDVKRPVGTGPFKYVSFTPGQQSVFARFDDYWNQPLPYADRLVMTNYADETSQVNALLSGAVTMVNGLSATSLRTVTASGKKVVISHGGGWNPFTMRVDQAPFSDVRVRQAFRLAVDRPKMLASVFDGYGTIGNDIFSIWSSDYDHSIPQREQDIERAKQLLKAAGRAGLDVQLITAPIAQGAVNQSEVLAQQAALAGINVNLRQVTVTEIFGPNYLSWPFAIDYWYYKAYLPQVAQATLPGAPYNETHFDDPRYNKLFAEAKATIDATRRAELAHEMQLIDYNQGGYIIPFFPPVIDGYAPNVKGAVMSKTGSSFNEWDFQHLWLS